MAAASLVASSVARAPIWADAVFHVLAHVDGGTAASCFSPTYCEWAASRLGAPSSRTLAEDIEALRTLAHPDVDQSFARAQAIAWIFRTTASVEAASDFELRDARVDNEPARVIALGAGPIAEVLRAAAELEMLELERALATLAFEPPTEAIERVTRVAPLLASCTIEVSPALGLRGRVLDRHIFVGMPGIAGATSEHVAWQAAHEATVQEVSAAATLPFLELERRALGLLRSRARRVGLADAHAAWLAHLDLSGLGGLAAIADVEDPT